MLGPDDLVLCAGPLRHVGLVERIEAAAGAGFAGLSLFYEDYERARAEGIGDADLRAMLDDKDLAIAELDPLVRWLPETRQPQGAGVEMDGFFKPAEADFYALADLLGARSINVVMATTTFPDVDVIAEAFGAVCDRAAGHGLVAHLEFLPWTQIPDLAAALDIVERADRPNGGVMLDSWHFFRSGSSSELLRATPGSRILGVQLNDAPAEAEDNLVVETLTHRLLPGEGDIDLVDLLRALDEIGSQAPLGVEVFSDSLAQLPAAEAANRLAEATRDVLVRAGRRRV